MSKAVHAIVSAVNWAGGPVLDTTGTDDFVVARTRRQAGAMTEPALPVAVPTTRNT